MKPGLSDRLARLKKTQKGSSRLPDPASHHLLTGLETSHEIPISLRGGWKVLEEDLWVRERRCASPLKGFRSSSILLNEYPPLEKWMFYDTETTGLSGGAGNIAFLVGIGRQEGDEFKITQYFLRDYPGEPALLTHLKKEIEGSQLFLSYNGKSFDKPLLETRFLMNRISCRMGAQLDLLYPVRSFFRNRMPNCRLGTVEEELLGIHRTDDIPGAEIPDIWFEFLKAGNHPDLNRVMEHNDMDILSLAVLVNFLEEYLISPAGFPLFDPFALGRYLLVRQDFRALSFLQTSVDRGDLRGEVFLSLYWKRQGEWEKAVALWRHILVKRTSPFAAVELAKYLEHKKKDIPAALVLIDSLLRNHPLQNPLLKQDLHHRRARLVRKKESFIADRPSETLE
ncbi:ribonuclease H-like domain-containing protein [Oceanispirochaeta sp.]|jgi:uncharacterized protein YprB with RNaseH-like and TPR domain|uniref:ribonuclease H-like domain-containing protein n=1 Tax=Oceanispirochaeta sp. TaxID=2035350 RepID=UPI002624736B|nr:ribonuclease H-like domain-containing protein [Oceanispirochaeta sp.]MDA3957229.1 ribonuclease H-like domain-containing protein [Oceanispirochaeta sp.]